MNKKNVGLAMGVLTVASFALVGFHNAGEIKVHTAGKQYIDQAYSKRVERVLENKVVESKLILAQNNVVKSKLEKKVVSTAKVEQEMQVPAQTVATPVVIVKSAPEEVQTIVVEPEKKVDFVVEESDQVTVSAEEIVVEETVVEEAVVEEAADVVLEDVVVEEEIVQEEPKIEEAQEEEGFSVSFTGFVTESLNVRSSRSTSSQVIGVLEKGVQLNGEVVDGWLVFEYNGAVGYVSESFLSVDEVVVDEVVEPTVEEPVVEEPVVEEPVVEEPVVEEPEVEAPVVSGSIDSLLQAARNLVGSPYVFAAADPSVGFDCSGFTSYLYREYAGVHLGRITTDQQYNGYGVSKENIQPGDLILFQNSWSSVVDHVAIYLGNGEYVHAATEERGVVIDSTNGSYYQNNVVGVRRIIN